MTNALAIRARISERIQEYDDKRAALPEQLKLYEQACKDLLSSACVGGTYGQVQIRTETVHERTLQESLLKSAWLNIHKGLNMDLLMSANDKKRFEHAMASPPEFTIDNIRATFGDYIIDPWGNILRGLAEVFSDLDQSFKSHEKMKIGVAGLPKRIIMRGFGGYSSWGWEKLADVVNALASFQGKPLIPSYWTLKSALEKDPDYFLQEYGFSLRLFENGNGHMIFTKEALQDVNKALAQFYGEVLADCSDDEPKARQQSTAVSKDLQYYPTPEKVVEKLMADLYIKEGEKVLEPSCGCGRIMQGVRRAFPKARIVGIEVDPGRAEEARAKGFAVQVANFLETRPSELYDHVIMNPPFYGKHYAKHITHAMTFLKEGGRLTAILPISARYDHGLVDGRWSDLPVGSFSESGTNINTTVLTIFK